MKLPENTTPNKFVQQKLTEYCFLKSSLETSTLITHLIPTIIFFTYKYFITANLQDFDPRKVVILPYLILQSSYATLSQKSPEKLIILVTGQVFKQFLPGLT